MAERDVAQRREQRGGRESWLPAAPGGPFTFMRRFAEEMDRLFDDFGGGPRIELRSREGGWTPQIEACERGDNFIVRADLPGLTRDQIHVDVQDDVLCIQGERQQEHREEGEGFFHSERQYGGFRRSIPLPEGVDADQAKATFRDGVLEVCMPMPQAQRRSRRIEIGEGQANAPGGGTSGTSGRGRQEQGQKEHGQTTKTG
jgi:HSP20 family protein